MYCTRKEKSKALMILHQTKSCVRAFHAPPAIRERKKMLYIIICARAALLMCKKARFANE